MPAPGTFSVVTKGALTNGAASTQASVFMSWRYFFGSSLEISSNTLSCSAFTNVAGLSLDIRIGKKLLNGTL